MSKIISIATAVPEYRHTQQNLLDFMEGAYGIDAVETRKLSYLYKHSGIDYRYSVIPDYSLSIDQWQFYPKSRNLEPFPKLEQRMEWYKKYALQLSLKSAADCLEGKIAAGEVTHLITVSCTGMSAPGLELELMEAMGLRKDITRTAINFMGCYAAVHGLKMANDMIRSNPGSKVLVVCTELCSLHFQKTFQPGSITAPLLFGDGSAAVLLVADDFPLPGLQLESFYAEVLKDAKNSMTWELSSTGFIMTLEADVPEIFRADIGGLKNRALQKAQLSQDAIGYWCIHPGGKRILEAVGKGLNLDPEDMNASYETLRNYGNMSSATILFVLLNMWSGIIENKGAKIFAASFGPGLTMESVIIKVV